MPAPPPHLPIEIVSCADPALDRRPVEQGGMNVERYWETRDPALIKEIPGKHARRYVLRPLRSADMDAIEASKVPARFAFQFALERVINYRGVEGSPWTPSSTIERGQNALKVVGEDEIDDACEGARVVIHEIGHVAITRASVGFTMADGVRFALPPSLADVLELLARRSVDTPGQTRLGTGTTSPPAQPEAAP